MAEGVEGKAVTGRTLDSNCESLRISKELITNGLKVLNVGCGASNLDKEFPIDINGGVKVL